MEQSSARHKNASFLNEFSKRCAEQRKDQIMKHGSRLIDARVWVKLKGHSFTFTRDKLNIFTPVTAC